MATKWDLANVMYQLEASGWKGVHLKKAKTSRNMFACYSATIEFKLKYLSYYALQTMNSDSSAHTQTERRITVSTNWTNNV